MVSFLMEWFTKTLTAYPEIAIFLSLGIGYYVGGKTFKGFSLGAVTATLLVAIAIGQTGITISPTVKAVFFLMFLFAVGYGVGPQFVRGIAKDGIPQALFSVVQCVLCLGSAVLAAKMAGYDLGSAAGLFAGSQTISASMGLATDAINRLGRDPAQTKQMLDAMPIAYAVTYIFGTIGSALLLAKLGPLLLGINLPKACKDYEARMGAGSGATDGKTAWHQYELRAYSLHADSLAIGKTVSEAEHLVPTARIYIERIRRGGKVIETNTDTVLMQGDVLAIYGRHENLVNADKYAVTEVDDGELVSVTSEGVDIYVTRKDLDSKTLNELSDRPITHGIFLKKIVRGATATEIPVLPQTQLHRGDILSVVGRPQDTAALAKAVGYLDRPSDIADVAFIGAAITIGALIGSLVFKVGSVPLTLSTAGGALISGLIFGWLRSVHPTFGRIPSSTQWFMNSVGLNVFIAVVGISAGPGFVAGLRELGISLFLWGVFATLAPLVVGMFVAKYVFRFDPAILLGVCAGSRTTTAALGMICDAAGSQVPGLGYTVTYAVGNTLLTIWGMVIIMVLS